MASTAAPNFAYSSNSQELTAKLNQIGDQIEEPEVLLENIGSILERGEQEVFGTEGASIGWAWNN